jgi:tRNA nucleotidyltransferase/poly(A) polymerase
MVTSAPRDVLKSLYPRGRLLGKPAAPVYLVPLPSGTMVEFSFLASSLEKDLARRDFTINSLAMDGGGKMYGSPQALEDLRKRILRWNGSPEDRLRQDPLRGLRLCRLGASLKDFHIPPKELEACIPFAQACAQLPGERVGEEMYRGLKEQNPAFPDFLRKAELLAPLWGMPLSPRLGRELPLFSLSCRRGYSFSCSTGAFFLDLFRASEKEDPREMREKSFSLLRRWCWPEKKALWMGELLRLYGDTQKEISSSEAMDLLERFGFPWLEDFSELLSLEPQKALHGEELQRKCLLWKARLLRASQKGLFLSGETCMRILARPPGPWLGRLLQALQGKILETPEISREELLRWLLEEGKNF